MSDKTGKNIFVTVVSVLISGLLAFSFYRQVTDKPEIVQKADAAVAVKNGSSYIYRIQEKKWSKIKDTCTIKIGNSIKTDPDSSCELFFYNGAKVLIMENSLLKLSEEKENCLKLCGNGIIFIDAKLSSCDINLVSDNENILIVEKGSSAVVSVKGTDVDSTVINGRVVIISGDVEKTVQQGSGFYMNDEGIISRRKMVLLSPLPETFSENPADVENIKFEWKKNNASVGFIKIEVSYDKNFKSTEEYIENADTGSVFIPVKKGTAFWRLNVLDSDGKKSEEALSYSGKIRRK